MPFLHLEEGLFFAFYATANLDGAVLYASARSLCAAHRRHLDVVLLTHCPISAEF
jgi:hypothetical protein